MATNRLAMREGDRQARRQAIRLGEEFAALRLRADLTQAAVGRALGVDRTMISRLELGDPRVGLLTRFRVAALLGADLRLSAYTRSGPLIRDTAQARIVEAVLAGIDRRWKRTVEAPVPGADRRSIDLRLDGPAGVILCEVESRVGSLEEIVRELHSKRDAVRSTRGVISGSPIRVVLILPRTRHHLEIVRHHPKTIEAAFSMPSAAVAAALQDAAIPWTGDGILWSKVATRPAQGRSSEDPLIHSARPAPIV
jgi:transcriptional regulator with XRE-family HTH domain